MSKKSWIDGLLHEQVLQKLVEVTPHVVHDYANLTSSARYVLPSPPTPEENLRAPLNTHVYHAFLLNCRKLTDFFDGRVSRCDDVVAVHFCPGFRADLNVCKKWSDAINKQLAHVTMDRVSNSRPIPDGVKREMRDELVCAWKKFLRELKELDAQLSAQFDKRILEKLREEGFGELDLH